jgi:hypothetical protein
MTDHPITPPRELVQKWFNQAELATNRIHCIATRAAQWGADQELEACCRELEYNFMPDSGSLRSARRPKPPSLKERAWKLLECYGTSGVKLTADQCNTIREALEDSNG